MHHKALLYLCESLFQLIQVKVIQYSKMCLAVQQKKDYDQIEDEELRIEHCVKIQDHDVLFILTYYTKLVLCLLNSVSGKFQNSRCFK